MEINTANSYRLATAEVLWLNENLKNISKETVQKLHRVFWWKTNNDDLKKHLKELEDLVDPQIFKTLWLPALINYLRTNGIKLDEILEPVSSVPDIPVQYRESLTEWVEAEFNATIWVLLNSNGTIVTNPQVIEASQNIARRHLQDEKEIVSGLAYKPWDWTPEYTFAMNSLIQAEEERYNWGQPNGTPTKPYFIPGWWWGLTLFRDYFLEMWDPCIAPSQRWPNIDWIASTTTKIPLTNCDFFDTNWVFNCDNLDELLWVFQKQNRQRVWLYLNFPNNPTGTTLSESDAQKLNDTISNYPELQINIVIDDPYGAFAIEEDKNTLKRPLSYMLNTPTNVTIIELWSHGTKEAGVYWLRSATLRILADQSRIDELEKKLSSAIRQTFSMSPSYPQTVSVESILWRPDVLNMTEAEVTAATDKYLDARKTTNSYVVTSMDSMKQAFEQSEITDFELFSSKQNGTNWFFLAFKLTESWKEKEINVDELRKQCIQWESKISFAVFQDWISGEQIMRVTLINDPKAYFERLKQHIEKYTNA